MVVLVLNRIESKKLDIILKKNKHIASRLRLRLILSRMIYKEREREREKQSEAKHQNKISKPFGGSFANGRRS